MELTKFLRLGDEDPMATLCRMVAETHYENLPSEVIYQAKRSILDTLAVTIGGSAMDSIRAVVDFAKHKGGMPESEIPLFGGKVPASEAAMAIGPMSRAMDLGDIHDRSGHCSEYVFPALLAALGLKAKVTGQEFIAAFVLGKEVCIRIGSAWNIPLSFSLGQGEGHGIFGATAAVGKLLGLSFTELQNAMGIARGLTQPHDLAMFSPATSMASIHHGFLCQAAINACLLAQRGITGPRTEVLFGKRGYLSMARWETDPGAILERLGEHWEMVNVTLKWFTSCGAIHTSIDALLSQMSEHGFEAGDIDSIHVDASPSGWQICQPKEQKWNPRTVAECQFSFPYVLATAAFDKSIFLDSYAPASMNRLEVRKLMAKISVSEDSTFPAPLAARVYTKLSDGRTVVTERHYMKGHPHNPLSDEELVEKFHKCLKYSVRKLDMKVGEAIIDAIYGLDNIEDVSTSILHPLVP